MGFGLIQTLVGIPVPQLLTVTSKDKTICFLRLLRDVTKKMYVKTPWHCGTVPNKN